MEIIKNCIICNKEYKSLVIFKRKFCSQDCFHKYLKLIPHKKGIGRHNSSSTPLYRVWRGMKSRCLNRNAKGFKHYGGRGIKICEKWLKFEGFFEDMGKDYIKGFTLDRIDNNGNYCKENCRWIPLKEQANNKRHSIHITHNGETLNLKRWSQKLGINYSTLFNRLKVSNFSLEDCLTLPITPAKKRGRTHSYINNSTGGIL